MPNWLSESEVWLDAYIKEKDKQSFSGFTAEQENKIRTHAADRAVKAHKLLIDSYSTRFEKKPYTEEEDPYSFVIPIKSNYVEEVDKKIWYEVLVTSTEVQVIQRGGPLEPVILSIAGKDINVVDDWAWGDG